MNENQLLIHKNMKKDYLKPLVSNQEIVLPALSFLQTSGNIEGLSESDYDGSWSSDDK